MKLSLAIAAITAAVASANPFAPAKSANNGQSAYVSKLVSGAKVLRHLEQDEDFRVDISGYSVKFQKCQFIKTYDDELAEEEETGSVLATKRFVVFRLCPNNSCGSCNYNYGEYLVDLETYLDATVEYQTTMQQNMCDACEECGNGQEEEGQEQEDNGERMLQQNYNVDCSSCYDECLKIQNMEENGYVDATNFLECVMVYDPDDDGKAALYAGPMCASDGAKIKIGVFSDENCNQMESNKDVDDYLMDEDGYPRKLSHALLKTVYGSDSCVSCLVPEEEDENGDENQDQEDKEPEVNELCEQLYEASAKCEQNHGFDTGYDNYYGNQAANEDVVCDFIDSVLSGSYDQVGEIKVNGSNGSSGGGAATTTGQKLALAFFVLGTFGLAFYAAMLHSQLTNGSTDGLSNKGGAMA